MFATYVFLLESFNKFNKLCFGDKLPSVPLYVTRAKKCYGKCEYYSVKPFLGEKKNFGFSIKITGVVDLPQNDLEDVIIHEMIHYYIAFNKLEDTSIHGRLFKSIMNEINFKYGRNVSVRGKNVGDDNTLSESSKSYILCISSLFNGNAGVTVCAKTRFFEIYRRLPKLYNIEKIDLYLSYDQFFSRYPRSNKPCVYKISWEDVTTHLKSARELEIVGNQLKLK